MLEEFHAAQQLVESFERAQKLAFRRQGLAARQRHGRAIIPAKLERIKQTHLEHDDTNAEFVFSQGKLK
jgi:hypothetical protein